MGLFPDIFLPPKRDGCHHNFAPKIRLAIRYSVYQLQPIHNGTNEGEMIKTSIREFHRKLVELPFTTKLMFIPMIDLKERLPCFTNWMLK